MPLARFETSVPANATVQNVFAGSLWQYLPWAAAINMGITADATGVLATVTTGQDTLLEESPVDILANLFPVIPDNMSLQDVAAAGELITVKLRNTTGAPIIARTLAQITPI